MEPLKSMEVFIDKLESAINEKKPSDQKIENITKLIDINADLLIKYKNPDMAKRFEELASRVSKLAADNNQQRGRIANLAKSLTAYAQDFRLLPEVMKQVIGQMSPKETKAVTQASKEIHRLTLEAFRGGLRTLNIKTAEQAIAFAEKYGKGLTYLDTDGISFTQDQLARLISLTPGLTTLIARDCEIKEISLFENLKRLEVLDLTKNRLGEAGASALAGSATFKNLRELHLGGNRIGDAGAKALAESPYLSQLIKLDLTFNNIGERGIKEVAASQTLTNIEELRLSDNSIGSAGASALASSTLKKLHTLELFTCALDQEATRALASSKSLATLRKLDLSNNRIEVKALFDPSSTLKNLSELLLRRCAIGDKEMEEMAKSALTNLQTLDLTGNDIGEGVAILAATPAFEKLQTLFLSNNHITDGGAKAIAEHLRNLQRLYLGENRIGDEGVAALAAVTQLQVLDLSKNNFGEAGVQAVAKSEALKNLKVLHMFGNNVDVSAIARSPILTHLHMLGSKKMDEEARHLLSLRKKLGHFSEEQQSRLYKMVAIFAKRDNVQVTGALDEWGKAQLFADPKRLGQAIDWIEKHP